MRNSSRSIPGGKFTIESQRHGENVKAESACFPLCLYVVSARLPMEGWESRRFGGRGRPVLHNDELALLRHAQLRQRRCRAALMERVAPPVHRVEQPAQIHTAVLCRISAQIPPGTIQQ